jgi:hypothetical protein
MSKIENQVIAKIQARAELGQRKYGTTMERKDLTFRQWVTHLQEELLDAAIYAEKLIDEISIPDMKVKHDNDVPAMAHELRKSVDAWGIYDEEMVLIKSYDQAHIAIEEANILNFRNKNKIFLVKKYTIYFE